MHLILKCFSVIFLVLLLVSCNSSQPEPLALDANNSFNKPNQVEINPNEDISVTKLSESFVIELVTVAGERYKQVIFDYNPDTLFEREGRAFMYYNLNLDSEEEMIAYLDEVYSKEIYLDFFGTYISVDQVGRLFHEYGEAGSLLQWADSDVISIKEESDETTQTFLFSVPEGDGNSTHKLELTYIEGKGWRVKP
jgi:hypothetical protein